MVNRLAQFQLLHQISDQISKRARSIVKPGQAHVLAWAAASLALLPLPSQALTPVIRPELRDLQIGYVLGIVDNTTLLMQVEGRAEIQVVRLLGLEGIPALTPSWTLLTGEPALPNYEAGQYLQDTLRNKQVYLEIDRAVIPPDGVLPAYVWRDQRLINQEMLFQGYALLSDAPAAIKYEDALSEAAETAQRQGRGTWSFYGPQPASDL